MSWFCKQKRVFTVTLHIDGRHPYLQSNELDYETRDVVLTVPAKDWNDAERVAFEAARSIPRKWACSVLSIAVTSS